MDLTQNSNSNVIVYNSITNTVADQKLDSVQPFSFLEFLNYSKSLANKIIQFADYQVYLKKWNDVTLVKYNDLNVVVRQQFIAFLKSISLNFTTAEEKRYISNIDFESNADLEIAVPFFTTKIKQVLLYFAEKRDTYAIDLELAKNKGSIFGITNYLKTSIIETIFGNDLLPPITSAVPLSTISNHLQVEVEQGYDTFNDYFDLDPFAPPSFYNAEGERAKYFTSNTNILDPNLFLDYDQAIINLINSERVVLQELQQLVVDVNTPNLELLQNSDFIDYDTRTRENLRLVLNAALIKKFTGTDFYYLSATSTGTVSGLLFEADSPVSNILNVYNATTLTVPQSSVKYERDVGLFFKPTLLSILQLQTPFNYTLKNEIKSDHVYVFPDPYNYGNISGLTKTDHDTPFNFAQQGQEIQKNISSNNALGNSFVTKNDFTFESYHSQEQQNSAKSVMQGLYNAGVATSYVSDIYGNIYFGLKLQDTDYIKNFTDVVSNSTSMYGLSTVTFIPYLSSIKSLINNGTFAATNSTTQSDTGTSNPSIYTTRNSVGNFLTYNVTDATITPLSAAYGTVILKYPTQAAEINNVLYNYEAFGSTFAITTSSYVIIDKFIYTDGAFYQAPTIPLILQSTINNKASNVYLNGNELFIAKVALSNAPLTSAYNSREYTISLQSFNINTGKTTNYQFSSSLDNTVSYSAGTLLNATNVNLIYNKKQGLYNIVITLKDLSNNLYIHSIFYSISNGLVSLVVSKIFAPTNNNFTINFYDNSWVSNLLYNGIIGTPTISTTNGTITF